MLSLLIVSTLWITCHEEGYVRANVKTVSPFLSFSSLFGFLDGGQKRFLALFHSLLHESLAKRLQAGDHFLSANGTLVKMHAFLHLTALRAENNVPTRDESDVDLSMGADDTLPHFFQRFQLDIQRISHSSD